MTKEKLKLVGVKFIDMCHFQMWEGKFKDMEQSKPTYIYANVSNFDTDTYQESEVRVYTRSYGDLYCADDYELQVSPDIEAYLKEVILKNIPYDEPLLCGFVFKHGDKDFSGWQVELSKEDEDRIMDILQKYEVEGCSVRNVYDCKFNEVF